MYTIDDWGVACMASLHRSGARRRRRARRRAYNVLTLVFLAWCLAWVVELSW